MFKVYFQYILKLNMQQSHTVETHHNNPYQHGIAWEVLGIDLDGLLLMGG